MLSLNIKFNENAKRKYKYYPISSAGRNTSPAILLYAFPRLSTQDSQVKDENAAKAVNP